MGVSAAIVTIDQEKQTEGSCTLGFIGVNGVSVEAGDVLFRKYLEFRANPMSETTYSRIVTGGNGDIM